MRNIDPVSIRLFLAILEEGSISKAAARECVVPSAVSKRIGALEEMFNVALLERTPKGVSPTPAGEALQHHARSLLQVIDRLQGEMSEYVDGVRGHIRVLTSVSSLATRLPGDIQDFMTIHQRIKIDLAEDITPAIFRAVRDGTTDIGIAPDIVSHEGLQVLPYRRFSLALVVPKDHPLAACTQIAYAQTLDYEQVELSRNSGMAELLGFAARGIKQPKRIRVRVSAYDTVCRMVANGMGVGVVPLFFRSQYEQSLGLSFVPLVDAWAKPTICIAVRSLESLPSAAKVFVAYLNQRIAMEQASDALLDSMSPRIPI